MTSPRLTRPALAIALLAGATALSAPPGIRYAPDTPPPVLHVRGGASCDVPLLIEIDASGPIHLFAQLTQLSSSLTAPLGPVTDLGPVSASQPMSVPLDVPDVTTPTEVLVRFSARGPADTDPPLAHGQLRLVVHPSDSLDGLRTFARRHPLGVFGTSSEIRAFLERERVAFKDLGEAPPRNPPVNLLAIGSGDDLLASVRVAVTPDGPRRRVTFPALPDLGTNPLTQETFLLILNQSIQP